MSLTERPSGAEESTEAELGRRLKEQADTVGGAPPGLVDELSKGLAGVLAGEPPPAGPGGADVDPAGRVESVRVVIEVVAGLVPGRPDLDFSRRWCITSAEWYALDAADKRKAPGESCGTAEALAQLAGKANGYAALLMLQPGRLNWVRVDWIWM